MSGILAKMNVVTDNSNLMKLQAEKAVDDALPPSNMSFSEKEKKEP